MTSSVTEPGVAGTFQDTRDDSAVATSVGAPENVIDVAVEDVTVSASPVWSRTSSPGSVPVSATVAVNAGAVLVGHPDGHAV